MRASQVFPVFFVISLFLSLAACSEESGSDEYESSDTSSGTPWNEQFNLGSPSINTGLVVSSQDGVSADFINVYVEQANLPNVDMEVFSVLAWLPVSSSYTTRVSNVSVVVRRTDGSDTGDIYESHEFRQREEYNGMPHDVFVLHGLFRGEPAIWPETFANVNFRFTVEWLNKSGGVAHTSQKTIEMYKR